MKLLWQSKLVLLLVVPAVATEVMLKTQWWASQRGPVAIWTLGLSLLLGLITWQLRAATPAAAGTGFLITASLMYSTVQFPYRPWHTALIPVLAVALLAFACTRVGRDRKERLGAAEDRRGRSAAQVAANLGFAALVSTEFAQSWCADRGWFAHASIYATLNVAPLLVAGVAAMAEAAADTVSSELGQVFGGRPRMITTLRAVEPGTDGAVSVAGTLAGCVAAAIVAALGMMALKGNATMLAVSCAGGIFGLIFDSVLGATLELRGWLNNDAVNFLSTAGAAGFALALMASIH